MPDVTVLFPGLERTARTQRGRAPKKYVLAPSYNEMVASIFTVLMSDVQEYNRSIATFYLLKRDNTFGYMKLVEDKDFPIALSCDSYKALQYLFDDICASPYWHDSLEEIITVWSTKPTARIKNDLFMKKIREEFMTQPVTQEQP